MFAKLPQENWKIKWRIVTFAKHILRISNIQKYKIHKIGTIDRNNRSKINAKG